jgi:hypothetical protein
MNIITPKNSASGTVTENSSRRLSECTGFRYLSAWSRASANR